MAGEVDKKYKDEELKELFRYPVVMSSDIAKRLCERGFSKYLGVTVEEWTGLQPSYEMIFENGQHTNAQVGNKLLVPVSDEVEVLSEVYNAVYGGEGTLLFPSCTRYKNELGGVSIVFAGTPITAFNYVEAFSFFTHSRKLQLILILRDCGCLPAYYASDEEVYCKVANTPSGELLVALFNLSYDIAEEIPLFVDREVNTVEMLCENGERKACSFTKKDGKVIVNEALLPLNPIMLFIK